MNRFTLTSGLTDLKKLTVTPEQILLVYLLFFNLISFSMVNFRTVFSKMIDLKIVKTLNNKSKPKEKI